MKTEQGRLRQYRNVPLLEIKSVIKAESVI